MAPAVIRRVVSDNQNCFMLKHEDWPGLEKITTLRAFQKDGSLRPISILTGNGGLFLDFEMERGADGAMTGYAFPDMLADLVNLSAAGSGTPHTTFSTPICPTFATSSNRSLASRRANM